MQDVKLLREELGIRSLFDFRSSEEQKQDSGWHLMLSNGVIKNYDLQGKLTQVTVDHNENVSSSLPHCELHRLSLIERDRFVRALIWRLPPLKVARALGYKAVGNKEKMRDVIVPYVVSLMNCVS